MFFFSFNITTLFFRFPIGIRICATIECGWVMCIRFNINTQKSIEALIWVVQRGESNLYNVMKILFAADKYHLNTYGRPVTGDRYLAMEYGTVPDWIYNATRVKKPGIGFTRAGNTLGAERGCDLALMSESDVEALEFGYGEYAGKDFNDVKKKNHAERSWLKAKEDPMGGPAPEIRFEDMIDEEWLIKDLRGMASLMVI